MANGPQSCFERYEKKYFLTPQQQANLLAHMSSYMEADTFGQYSICNIYYDTEDWRLIRASIEKPAYKEKLRVRSYGTPSREDKVFIELKKKCQGIVYKRRITSDISQAQAFLAESPGEGRRYQGHCRGKEETGPRGRERAQEQGVSGQIRQEIAWFQSFYHTRPRVFLAYDRLAFAGIQDPNLRITFDTNLRWRDQDLDLCLGDYGQSLLEEERILMEVKMPGACPLWLSRLLSEEGIFPISFSKYGYCYQQHLLWSSQPSPLLQPLQNLQASHALKKEVVSCA